MYERRINKEHEREHTLFFYRACVSLHGVSTILLQETVLSTIQRSYPNELLI